MVDGLEIIIVTGLSGSGKSVAIRALEDNGFFCIDNLPVLLIPKFIDLCQGYQEGIKRIALGVDLRGGHFFQSWPEVLAEMRAAGHRVEVLFFDATDEVLLRRFSETRRPHPLAGEAPVLEGIAHERKALEGMRALTDKIIDTSDFNVHELKKEMEQYFSQFLSPRKMAIFLTSFGYKYGIPHDTDMILDVRFLPNPFFVDTLKGKNGLESDVEKFVLRREETHTFLDRLYSLLEFTLPQYEREGKSSLTLALGCTGGKHRSVVLVEELKKRLDGKRFRIHVKHRDIDK
ncbi:MAG: RNase adapter RapZ [Deltaproteobacteria bacterium]|nr:RNase adapter RapZ [Deltaproteobacteria bacterium]MCZ6625796.1 RNase adapter RapZ [Deltaproteobacteria bacterium]